MSLSSQNVAKETSGLNSFRRMQLGLAWWGILLIGAGILHNTYSRDWSRLVTYGMWFAMLLLGLLGTYLLNSEILASGMLLAWGGLSLFGLLCTVILMIPFNLSNQPDGRVWISLFWHLLLAAGYALTARYMDKRWWFLVAWEVLAGLSLLFLLGGAASLPNPNPNVPENPNPYNYSYGMINFDLLWVQVQNNDFDLKRNLGLLFGLSSGLPLLLAALPFWKNSYDRS